MHWNAAGLSSRRSISPQIFRDGEESTMMNKPPIVPWAALALGLAVLGSAAQAGDEVTILRKATNVEGAEYDSDRALVPARVSSNELQGQIAKGAELLSASALTREDGKVRRTTSFLGSLFAPDADVTLRFYPSRELLDGAPAPDRAPKPSLIAVETTSRITVKDYSFNSSWFGASVDWASIDALFRDMLSRVDARAQIHRADQLKGNRFREGASTYPVLCFQKDGAAKLFIFEGAKLTSSPAQYNVENQCSGFLTASGKVRNPEADSIPESAMVEIQKRFFNLTRLYFNFQAPDVAEAEKAEAVSFELLGAPTTAAEAAAAAAAVAANSQNVSEFSKATQGHREPSFYIRVGDVDGFGYGAATGYYATNGDKPANPKGNSVLGTGDFMPNNDRGGSMATGAKDDFDHRSPAEAAGSAISVKGCYDVGTKGSEFTDISLSRSYDASRTKNEVHVSGIGATWDRLPWSKKVNNKTVVYNNPEWYFKGKDSSSEYGQGGVFPRNKAGDNTSDSLPNQPGFVFDFRARPDVLIKGQSIFFNMVTADYDVVPFQLILRNRHGKVITVPVVAQANSAGEDGLVQAAFSRLDFGFIFEATEDGGFHGYLEVDMDAPKEPYLCYDFVELSTAAIDITSDGNRLNIFGHVVYAADSSFVGDSSDFDVTRHEGDLLEAKAKRILPEPVFDPSGMSEAISFPSGTYVLDRDTVLDSMVLGEGARIIVAGNVKVHVLGDVVVPRGGSLIISNESSLELYAKGAVVLQGLVDSPATTALRIVSTVDSDAAGGKGVIIDIDGGRYIGSLVSKRISLAGVDDGKIRFTYDKTVATQGFEAVRKKVKVRALLDDSSE
jgi:hypothetical protein